MQMRLGNRLLFAPIVIAGLLLFAQNCSSITGKVTRMNPATPRVSNMFQKTKSVCFGRFMVDMPSSATVVWGETIVPLTVNIYPKGEVEVKSLAQKFIDELNNEKAINHNNVPLLLSVEDISKPEGKIIIGYEDFQSINGLKINGYFNLDNDGVVINARPLKNLRDQTIIDIKSIAHRLRKQEETEIPAELGNCIEGGFLPDSPTDDKEHPGELISIGFRLKEFPDAHFSIQIRPTNYHDPESASLKRQWARIKDDMINSGDKKLLSQIKFFRENTRDLEDWKNGYEVLNRPPDEDGVHSFHDFELRFVGVGHDPFKPYVSIQFQTGVADNAAGAAKTTLTDDEAIAIWDKVVSTVRVRPSHDVSVKQANLTPRIPLGESAATGRLCPQTGWWQADEPGTMREGGRQYIKAGDRMPHVIMVSELSMWQRLKNEPSSHRAATMWKLVDYDDKRMPSSTVTMGIVAGDATPGIEGEST